MTDKNEPCAFTFPNIPCDKINMLLGGGRGGVSFFMSSYPQQAIRVDPFCFINF